MAKKRTAFSLVELIIIVMWVGILAAIAVPRLNFAIISKQKADTVARKIVTDLRLTRRLAISNAAIFGLRMVAPSPYTTYEIIDYTPPPTVVDTHTIDSDVSCAGDSNFKFGPLGNLTDIGHTQLTLTAEGKSFTITIIPATGAVKCVEN